MACTKIKLVPSPGVEEETGQRKEKGGRQSKSKEKEEALWSVVEEKLFVFACRILFVARRGEDDGCCCPDLSLNTTTTTERETTS
eukprot:448503-Rhodomonas_salina.2